jgi:hypothetical protein
MLHNSDVAPRIPAQDLERAKPFHADKLGLTPMIWPRPVQAAGPDG